MQSRKRSRSKRLFVMLVLPVLISVCLACVTQKSAFAARTVVVGVLTDGPSPFAERFLQCIQQETRALGEDAFRIQWKLAPAFDAGWDASRTRKTLRAALRDPQVDIVMTLGALQAQSAATAAFPFSKPVLTGPLFDEQVLKKLPYKNDRSLKANFCPVVVENRVRRDITAFKDLVPFSRLHVLIQKEFVGSFVGLDRLVQDYCALFGIGIEFIPVGQNLDDVMPRLSSDVEAVYVTPLMRVPENALHILVEQLKTRAIPSWSFLGKEEVEAGILAGRTSYWGAHLSRRMALNIHDIAAGRSARSLPVLLSEEDQLFLNMNTARDIGFSPKYAALLTANLVGQADDDLLGTPLDLAEAMRIAGQQNVSLREDRAKYEEVQEDRRLARSQLLPQLGASARYIQIDQDISRASQGLIPWDRTGAGLAVSQMIFDDAVVSRFRAARRNEHAEKVFQASKRLDVVQQAGVRYLQLLSAQALLSIERDNYQLIVRNLDMARVRRETGVSGPEEVYRWEAALAESRARVIQRRADIQAAQYALNQALNQPLTTQWQLKDMSADQARRAFFDVKAETIGSSLSQLARLSDRAASLSAERPSLKGLELLVEAQDIVASQKARQRFVPSLKAGAMYTHEIDKHQIDGALRRKDPDDLEDVWAFGVTAELPLFAGGALSHEQDRANAVLRQVKARRERLVQLAAQQVRTVISHMSQSYPNIELSALAADRARKNLGVVRDKYARGAVSILELLDAQNQSLVQKQAAAIAVYEYVRDVLDFQRALGWFEIDATPQQKQEFLSRLGAVKKE